MHDTSDRRSLRLRGRFDWRTAGVVLSVLLLLCRGGRADEVLVRIVPVKGEPITGRLERWDHQIAVVTEGERAVNLPVEAVRRLRRVTDVAPALPPSSGCSIRLTNDDLLHADDVRMADETLTLHWHEPAAADVIELPLTYIRSILFHHDEPVELEASPMDLMSDAVLLTNRDRVTGEWTALDGQSVEIETVLGLLRIERSRVRQLDLNPQLADEPRLPDRYWVLSLQDGSHQTVENLSLTESGWRFQLTAGPERNVPVAVIRTISGYPGTIRSLAGLVPKGSETRTYFGEDFTPNRNRNVLGYGMRVAGETVPLGWGTSSFSSLTFSVPDEGRSFSTGIGLDDAAGELGGVSASVLVDGEVRWNRENITLRDGLSNIGPLDVRGAGQLTLRVDFGPRADVQDFLNWVDPVFLLGAGSAD